MRRLRRAVAGLVLVGVPTLVWTPARAQLPQGSVERGRDLYSQACITCHGPDGAGGRGMGPPLAGVGAASADFYLTTGRMPMPYPGGQSERKPTPYSEQQVADLVAYVASLGEGPPIPDVDPRRGDLVRGGDLYRANCAACHGYAGRGGALSNAKYAPSVEDATALQTVEAMRIGPGTMPVFPPESFDRTDADSIARYVEYLHDPEDRGGADLGYNGPIPEGLVVWLVGVLGLTLVAVWIGSTR